MTSIYVNLCLNAGDLASNCNTTELKEFIHAVDQEMADTDFTLALIKELAENVCDEMEGDEEGSYNKLIRSLLIPEDAEEFNDD